MGCAQLAKPTGTPAARYSVEQLEQQPTPSCERYYLLLFGSQSSPMLPRKTHSWATAVRVVDQGPGQSPIVEQHTISWMPSTLRIRPFRFKVEPGVNLDLHFSFEEMLRQNEHVSLLGPYQIRPGLFRKFVMQKEFVASGAIGYQACDTAGEAFFHGNGRACVHAISDLDLNYARGYYWQFLFGSNASRFIADQMARHGGFIDTQGDHQWLVCLLGLDRYPMERLSLDGPRVRQRFSGAFSGVN
jgi:hypothetical protein